MDRLLVIGHRGAAGLEPENTVAGFAHAVGLGVDGIELDVRMVAGRVVVIHDERVDRTTNGTGPLTDLSFDELRRLDAGDGQPVPTLEEVLAAVPEDVMVNIELKGPDTAEAVARLVAEGSAERCRGDAPAVLVSSFDHDELRRFHDIRPGLACAPLAGRWSEDLASIAASLDAWSVNLSRRAATEACVAAVRSWGRRCLVYTVNDAATARKLWAMGVNGVFTDYPDRLVGDPESRFSSSASCRCNS